MSEDRKVNGTKINRKDRFNFSKLIIKLTSRKFWVWLLSSYFINSVIKTNDDKSYFIPLIIVWGVVTIIYLIGEPIEKALSVAVEKMELKLQMNNTIDTKIGNK